jgi:Matrixin
MHGPPPSWANGVPQTWPEFPLVKVLDTIAFNLRPRRKEKWRTLRTEALHKWIGFDFHVFEMDPADYPALDPNDLSDAQLEQVIVQPYLRLMSMPGPYGGKVPAVAAWMPMTDPGAFAAFHLKWFWLSSLFTRRLALCHEVGHALGLSHRSESKASVMYYSAMGYAGTSTNPDGHDLDSLALYYP